MTGNLDGCLPVFLQVLRSNLRALGLSAQGRLWGLFMCIFASFLFDSTPGASGFPQRKICNKDTRRIFEIPSGEHPFSFREIDSKMAVVTAHARSE